MKYVKEKNSMFTTEISVTVRFVFSFLQAWNTQLKISRKLFEISLIVMVLGNSSQLG